MARALDLWSKLGKIATELRSNAASSTWYWALVPILAILAYAPVLTIGFLADDFFLLYEAQQSGIDPFHIIQDYQGGFLRPVGVLLTYQLGWALWGLNPLPYHVIGLLTHALSSLFLGRWLYTVTDKPLLGWLAGALFAVFPLHVEAVGWVAAQYDSFSLFFTLGSLWCFTAWWKKYSQGEVYGGGQYFIAWLLFGLAVFTKESVFTFIPIFALSAWVALPPTSRKQWRLLAISTTLFIVPIALNLIIRYSKIGGLGGYGGVGSDFADFVWDYSGLYLRSLLAPLSQPIFGNAWVQIVGILSTVAILVGLTLFGREQRKLLMLAGSWMALTLLPVLSLPRSIDDFQRSVLPVILLNVNSGTDNLQQNRYLYLVSAGFLSGVAVLLYSAITSARTFRPLLVGLTACLLIISTGLCWMQLRPWHTATVQARELEDYLIRVIPPEPRANGLTWYVDQIPFRFKGAPLLQSGLGLFRFFLSGDYPQIERVPEASAVPLSYDPGDAFALKFGYDASSERFGLIYGKGITDGSAPPQVSNSNESLLWDFTTCDEASVRAWSPVGGSVVCRAGEGLILSPNTADAQLISEGISLAPPVDSLDLVRLRVSISYDALPETGEPLSEWFWKGEDEEFNEQRHQAQAIKQDGRNHVYWTFLPAYESVQHLNALRFDPTNTNAAAKVRWIALEIVR